MRNQTEIDQFNDPMTDNGDKRKVVHNLSTLINARLREACTEAGISVPKAIKADSVSSNHLGPTPLEKLEGKLRAKGCNPAPERFLAWREEHERAKRARKQ